MSGKPKRKPRISVGLRSGWRKAGIPIIAVVAAMVGYWLWGTYAELSVPDTLKLLGQWQRSDGGYVLELSAATPKGVLAAAYFNPRPINVARAQWKHQDNSLYVFVELRDVKYPGSTYSLSYDPVMDRLTGIYFQAALAQQFEVEFKRKK